MIRDILVMHHSHTDIGFTHPQPVWWEMSRRFIDEALDLVEETADWPEESRMRWTCESTLPVMNWLAQARSAQVDRFVRLAAAGLVSVAALPCNLTMLPDLEQLTRGLQPVSRLRREFGLPVLSAVAHDVNGIPWPVTQILLDAGVELLIMGINTHFGVSPLHRPMAFHWQGSDRRPLLTFNGEVYTLFDGVAYTASQDLDLMAEGLDRYLASLPADYPYDFAFLTATHRPDQNDNNPPDPWLPKLVRQWNSEGRQPAIRLVTPEMLLDRLKQQPQSSISVESGDWMDPWSFGLGSAAFETRVGQQTRARLSSTGLARLASWQQKSSTDDSRSEKAFDALNLWTEHTWQADTSLTFPASDFSREQWAHKMSYLYQARSETSILMRDALDRLAVNPTHARGFSRLLVFNPSPTPRKAFIRLPDRLDPEQWGHFSASVLRLDPMIEISELEGSGMLIGPVELPANGWKVLSKETLFPAGLPAGASSGAGWLQSPTHRLEYDPVSGRITALVDRRNGWDVVDLNAPWEFCGLVHEKLDTTRFPAEAPYYGRDAAFTMDWGRIEKSLDNWQPDWPAIRQGPDRLLECRTEITPEGVCLVRRWEGAGVIDLIQRITLQAHRPVIEVITRFRLPERILPEAYYLAFPVNLSGWQAHYDSSELPVAFDHEQLPGSCKAWLAVTRWLNLGDAHHSLTFASPDAPLFQLGGFNWGKNPASVHPDGPALALAWLTNNYWNCNFPSSQPGEVCFRHELTTQSAYEPLISVLSGLEASQRIEIHPVLGNELAEGGQIIQVKGTDVVLLNAQPSGDEIQIRLANVGDSQADVMINLPDWPVKRAWWINSLGNKTAPIQIDQGSLRTIIPLRAVRSILVER